MTTLEILDALHRNGTITERARLAGRSLDQVERNIVWAARRAAAYDGFNTKLINITEMEGQRDHTLVKKKLKVVAKFAYWHDGHEEIPPIASYFILKSNHPALPVNGNVEAAQLKDAGINVPRTPSYQAWVFDGRKCFRGKK